MLIDTFAWEPYEKALRERARILPEVMTKRNKVIADTKNFYAVVGSGAFVHGHLLVIPKKLTFAFASLPDDQIEEADWFISKVEQVIFDTYGQQTIVAEHGMCHTPPSERKHYDHAHIHLFPVSDHVTEQRVTDAINFTLERRAPNVTKLSYLGKDFTTPADISEQFRRAALVGVNKNDLRIEGEHLSLYDIKQYPMDDLILSGRRPMEVKGMYTYFRTPWAANSFMTHHDLQSQITRHIVYNAGRGIRTWEQDKGTMEWKWQENIFWANMEKTFRDIAPAMERVEADQKARKFKFKNDVLLSKRGGRLPMAMLLANQNV